jgi:hypothetical protein
MIFSRRSFLVVCLPLLSTSCGYSLAGRGSFLPDYIRTIGVPVFVNTTPYFEVELKLTEKVRSEFIGRGRYQVLPQEGGVDAVLKGTISSISIQPATFDINRQASRYVISVTTAIEFRDVQANKVLWQNSGLVVRQEYDLPNAATALDNTFFGQEANALERVSSEFARSVVSAILEAF